MRLTAALLAVAGATALASPAAAATAAPFEQVEFGEGEYRLRGVLFRPEGPGPFPAVVALHACGGLNLSGGRIGTRYHDWGERLVKAGFVVLYPDSYGSRGLGSQCTTRTSTVRIDRERVADADAALRWLQEQSWVVPERVALVGWSEGGISALWAVRPRTRMSASKPDAKPDFRSAVAFYPGCRRLGYTAWSARVPTLIMIGRADDQSSASVCEQMVAGARGRSARISLVVYPGAYHDFDHPNRPLHMRTGYVFSVDGSGRVHTGTNPQARADAIKRVPEWLAR
jgi:dienelactone hydrolase